MGRGTVMVRAPLVPAALVGMLTICALALSSIYSGELMARLLIGAAAVAVAISLAVKRLPAWTAAPVSVLALAGYTLLAVRLSAASGDISGGLRDLTLDALRNGIPRLLTALIPIEPQPDTVIVPVLATWLAGLASAEIALRGRRVLLGYAPLVALYAGVLYLVGPNAQPAHWQSLAFAGCAAIGLAASAGASTEGLGDLSRGQHTVLRLRVAAGAVAVLAAARRARRDPARPPFRLGAQPRPAPVRHGAARRAGGRDAGTAGRAQRLRRGDVAGRGDVPQCRPGARRAG